MERVGRRVEDLDRLAAADRPLDADRRRLAERDREAVLVGERRLDDLPLHLAVERDGDLRARVVLPDVDQRVLLGQLPERDAQPPAVRGIGRLDDRLERRRCEVVLDAARGSPSQSPIWISPRPQSFAISPAATASRCTASPSREDAERGHPAGVEAVARPQRSRRRAACTRSGLAVRAALDLEDTRRERSVAVADARGEQLRDPAHHAPRRRRR